MNTGSKMDKLIFVNGDTYESIHIHLPKDYLEYFDFIDLGAKKGGLRQWASRVFNTYNGLHIEISPEHIKYMEENNFDCIQADITNLEFDSNCVDFVVCTHTIEHLPNLESIQFVIESALNVAKHFVYFTWPFFDEDEYLKELGLIPFWSTWTGHTCHVTMNDITNILREIGVLSQSKCFNRDLIKDSNHNSILSIDSPPDSDVFSKNKNPLSKKYSKFDRPIYYECGVFIPKEGSTEVESYFETFKKLDLLQ